MGKSTISMVIFNSYVTNYQRLSRMWLDGNSQWAGAWCSIFFAAAWSQHPLRNLRLAIYFQILLLGVLGRAKVGGITKKKDVWLPVSLPSFECSFGRLKFVGPEMLPHLLIPSKPNGTRWYPSQFLWLVIGWFFLHKYGNNYSNNYSNRF